MTPLQTFLQALAACGSPPQRKGDSYWARCPCHNDTNPSLQIKERPDGSVWFRCWAGCRKELILQVAKVTWRDLSPPKSSPGAKPAAGPRPAGIASSTGQQQKPKTTYATDRECIAALQQQHGHPSLISPYHNAESVLVCQVLRWDKKGAGKIIRPSTVAEGGRWKLGMPPPPRPALNLPRLMQADPSQVIWLVEGEKKCAALEACDLLSTTSMGGANGYGKTSWDWARGKRIVALPDFDDPGMQYAEGVGRLCLAAGAAEFKILRLWEFAPGLPKGGDIADVLESENWCGLPIGSFAEAAQWLQRTEATVAPLRLSAAVAVLDGRNVPWPHAEGQAAEAQPPTELAQQPGQDGSQLDGQA